MQPLNIFAIVFAAVLGAQGYSSTKKDDITAVEFFNPYGIGRTEVA